MNKKRRLLVTFIILSMVVLLIFKENYTKINAKQGDIYVSPTGVASNLGTYESPIDLVTAINKVAAGNTIWMLPGTYTFSQTITISDSNCGNVANYKSLRAYNNANVTLDCSSQALNGSNRGIKLDGSYWHIYGIDIKGAGDNGMMVSGNNNIIEMCRFYENRDTGLQISRKDSSCATIDTWPSNNLIKNCTSFNNCDATGENADGFAPKLTCGNGNVFDGCISYCNSDDGWDLYAKTDSGPIGVVTLKNCVAFGNGKLTDGRGSAEGDMNGFKLGGMGVPTAHIVENCIAFNNGATGFTDNNNGGALSLKNCTAINNSVYKKTGNFICYRASSSAKYTNILSYASKAPSGNATDNYKGSMTTSVYEYKGKSYYTASTTFSGNSKQGTTVVSISNADFESVTVPGYSDGKYTADYHKIFRNADGSINLGGLFEIKSTSALKGYGVGASLSTVNTSGGDTQDPTQGATQEPTQAPTQAPTQEPTQAPTQGATQKSTQTSTQVATETETQEKIEVVEQDDANTKTNKIGAVEVILILLAIVAVVAIGFVVYTFIKTKNKQKSE